MKHLVVGRDGQVGHELLRTLAPLGEVVTFPQDQFDLAKPETLAERIRAVRPDWIINAAAYTAVDQAEKEEALALKINGDSPGVLAEEAKKLGAGFVHFSTDYVFDGSKTSPYVESDAPNPLGAYGRTKLAGERNVEAAGGRWWTFRTSWVYAPRGKNFMLTMLKLAKERPRLRVVADQVGAPTTAALLAEIVAHLIASKADASTSGLYHATAGGKTSWHGFAEAIIKGGAKRGLCNEIPVDPISTAEYPLPAKRPANSVLDHQRLVRELGFTPHAWEAGLEASLDQLR